MLEKIRAATAANRVYFLGSIFFLFAGVLVAVPTLLFPNMPNWLTTILYYVPAILGFGSVSLWFQKAHGKQVAAFTPATTSQFLKVIPLVILGMIAMLPITALSMVINEKIWGLQLIENIAEAGIPTPTTGGGLILSLIVFAVLPACIEEFMFRGILQRANTPNLGKWAPIYAGIAFGLMHANLVSQWGLIIVGIIIGLILYQTGSLKLCIWYHFLHNAIAIVMSFALEKFAAWGEQMYPELLGDAATQVPSEVYTPLTLIIYFILGIGALIGALAIIRSMRKYKGTAIDQTIETKPIAEGWVAPVLSIDEQKKKAEALEMNQAEVVIENSITTNNELKPFARVNYIWYAAGIVWSLLLAVVQAWALTQ